MSRRFSGFSEDTLAFQEFLRAEKWSRSAWDQISKDTWKNNVRPEIIALLSDCANELTEKTGIKFDSNPASGYNQGGPTKFFWGAVIPEGGHKQKDIQLFVALRSSYVRAGLFLKDTSKSKDAWDFAISSMKNNEQQISKAIEHASIIGIEPCIPLPDNHKGTPIPTKLDPKSNLWSTTFVNHKQMDILKAWKVEDPILRNPNFANEIISVFMELMPLYRIISNPEVFD